MAIIDMLRGLRRIREGLCTVEDFFFFFFVRHLPDDTMHCYLPDDTMHCYLPDDTMHCLYISALNSWVYHVFF